MDEDVAMMREKHGGPSQNLETETNAPVVDDNGLADNIVRRKSIIKGLSSKCENANFDDETFAAL